MTVLDLQSARRRGPDPLVLLIPRRVEITPRGAAAGPELKLRPSTLVHAVSGPSSRPSKNILLGIAATAAVALTVGGGISYRAYAKEAARETIIAAGGSPEANGLLSSLANGQLALIDAYRTIGIDIAATPRAIEAAIESGSSEVLASVIKAGATKANEPNAGGLLLKAAATDQGELLRQLAAIGFDINEPLGDGRTLLESAAGQKKWLSVRALVDLGARFETGNPRGNTLAHLFAPSNDPSLIDLLKAKGVPLDQANRNGHTPIVVAAAAGADKVVGHLIRLGQDPTQGVAGNPSAFELAVQSHQDATLAEILANSPPAINLLGDDGGRRLIESGMPLSAMQLVGRGIDPNGTYADGMTPLGAAVNAGHLALIGQLLEKGARADGPMMINGVGNVTPLMLAALAGNFEIASAFVKAGAARDSVATNGLSVQTAAERGGHPEIIKLVSEMR